MPLGGIEFSYHHRVSVMGYLTLPVELAQIEQALGGDADRITALNSKSPERVFNVRSRANRRVLVPCLRGQVQAFYVRADCAAIHLAVTCWITEMKRAVVIPNIIRPLAA